MGKGSCGYPLHQPPPASLYGSSGLVMKSYLHRIVPTGDRDDSDGHSTCTSVPGSPKNSADSPLGGSDASESSSEDSNSEDGGEEGHDGSAKQGRVHKWAYSAVGKVRLCEPPNISCIEGFGSCTRGPVGTVRDPANISVVTSGHSASAQSANADVNAQRVSNGVGLEHRNSKVL